MLVSLHSTALCPADVPSLQAKGWSQAAETGSTGLGLSLGLGCYRCLCLAAKEQFTIAMDIDGEDSTADMQHLNMCDGLRKAGV